jgi:hypothetical protein
MLRLTGADTESPGYSRRCSAMKSRFSDEGDARPRPSRWGLADGALEFALGLERDGNQRDSPHSMAIRLFMLNSLRVLSQVHMPLFSIVPDIR